MNWLKKLFGGSSLNLKQSFEQFIEYPQGISLTITTIYPDLLMGCTTLALKPDSVQGAPGKLLSYIKAKLLCEMPVAIQRVPGFSLIQARSIVNISYGGKDFAEPCWYIRTNSQTFGPLSFRHGNWDNETGEYEFTLMQIYDAPLEQSKLSTLGEVTNKIAQGYKDNVHTFTI